MKTFPLRIASNASERCSALFRSLRHPGHAMFADIAKEQVDSARQTASSLEKRLSKMLADGHVDAAEAKEIRTHILPELHHIAG
jgi:hypothetical protein